MSGDTVGLTTAAYLLVMHVQERLGHLWPVHLPDEERWLMHPLSLDAETSQLPRDRRADLGWQQTWTGVPCGLIAKSREGVLKSPEAGAQLPGAATFPWATDLLALVELCLVARSAPDPAG